MWPGEGTYYMKIATFVPPFWRPFFRYQEIYTHQKSSATLDDEILQTEIAVELEMWDVLEVHDVQT